MSHRPEPTFAGSGSLTQYQRDKQAWDLEHARRPINGDPNVPPNVPSDPPSNPDTPLYDLDGDGVPETSWNQYQTLFGPDGGGGGGTSYPPRTLAEDLEYLREQYRLSEDEKIAVLIKQYELEGESLAGLEKIRHENKLAEFEAQGLDKASKIEFLEREVALNLETELAVLKQKAEDAGTLQDDAQEFERLESAKDRDWKEEENRLGREMDERLAGMDIASREALQAARLAAEQAMQREGFTHAENLQAAKIAADRELAGMKIAAEEKMQLRELIIREKLTNLEIVSQEKIAADRIAADKARQEAGFEHEKELREEDRKLDRQKMVTDLMSDNPVQAVLLAMGIGGDLPGQVGGQFEGLGPMEGAEQLKTETETALRGIEGAGTGITIGEEGVSGLAGAHKFARSFGQGSEAQRKLLTSASGITGGQQAGISAEEVEQRAAAVTPKGFDTRSAAVGAGLPPIGGGRRGTEPIQSNTVYRTGEGQIGDGTRPEALVVGQDQKLESIVPLTEGPETVAKPIEQPADALTTVFNDPNYTLTKGISQPEPPNILPIIGAQPPTPAIPPIQQPGEVTMTDPNQKPINVPSNPDMYWKWDATQGRWRLASKTTEPEPIADPKQVRAQLIERRKQEQISRLPPDQQRRIRQQEAIKSRDDAVKNIDLTKFGPEVIKKLMELSSNPNSPYKPKVDAILGRLLPQIRNRGATTRAATGLTNIL